MDKDTNVKQISWSGEYKKMRQKSQERATI